MKWSIEKLVYSIKEKQQHHFRVKTSLKDPLLNYRLALEILDSILQSSLVSLHSQIYRRLAWICLIKFYFVRFSHSTADITNTFFRS